MTYPKATTAPDPDDNSIPSSPRFAEIEERVLAFWKADDTFRASVARNLVGDNGSNEYVFYDGPPFANGLPHYGHLLTGYVKDIVPRFQTMRGRHVERRFGWDTHGLPAELETMSQLGIKTTDEIQEMGIGKFNAEARASVLRYTQEWRDYVTRQARWVDFDNEYKTLDLPYMESVLWAFKSLWDKGLVYEGFKVLPYCWNDQTPLSNHELRMDEDVYQVRRDPAVTVGFRLETGELALIWTTTPWTLPSNLAIMVHPDVDYVVVESDFTGTTERYILAEARLSAYTKELGEDVADHVVERLKGADLVGRSYTPPMNYYQGWKNAHKIVPAEEFVTTTEGTGLVHSAGAFGEEDKIVTDRNNIEPVVPVGPDGKFTAPVSDYLGVHVFDANVLIIEHLKNRTLRQAQDTAKRASTGSAISEGPELVEGSGSGASTGSAISEGPELVEGNDLGSTTEGTVLLRQEMYDHSYPHCWRCRNPLIYMGVSSWFVRVTEFKDRMGELNQQINWVPEHIKDGQFGKWLANARDWSISRNRFFGSPIPVWKSDDPAYPRVDVYGSLSELEQDFGVEVNDLHRPFIDELTRPNPDDPSGKSTMRRVPEILDVWFDSGSMPYAQVHYPFENAEWFEHHYPGDFIVEYVPQIRGWFYLMHVLATALFDSPAFLNCICHGTVLGSDGRKMSKSLRNYPDVREVFDRDGADAMRWFLMSSPVLRGGDLAVTEQGIREGVRQVIIPLWNAWYFFSLYANSANGGSGYDAQWSTSSDDVLDRYILAKLRQTVIKVGDSLEALDIAAGCDEVRWFVEVLSNWYIRRSRDRFWDGESEESKWAFDTLSTVLEVLTRIAAPLLPLVSEEIWKGLTGGRSVHLTDWPDIDQLPADDDLVTQMDRVRDVCSATAALRKAKHLRVRLPLAGLRVAADDAKTLQPFIGLIGDELNVKSIELVELADAGDDLGIQQELQVNARAAGPRLGRRVQDVIKASKSGDWWVAEDGAVGAAGIALQEGEFSIRTVVAGADDDQQAVAMLPGSGFVILDTGVTPELQSEGVARDLVRAVQQARRDAGLDISDRIALSLQGDDEIRAAVEQHRNLIESETLTEQLTVAVGGAGEAYADLGEGRKVSITVTKIN